MIFIDKTRLAKFKLLQELTAATTAYKADMAELSAARLNALLLDGEAEAAKSAAITAEVAVRKSVYAAALVAIKTKYS